VADVLVTAAINDGVLHVDQAQKQQLLAQLRSRGFVGGQTETVKIWSGANGTGTVLATIILSNNNGACTTLAYCTWSVAGTKFSGTAMSVTFSGPANELGLTDITIGSSNTAIPEPSSLYLLGTGIAGISLSQLRRLFGASK